MRNGTLIFDCVVHMHNLEENNVRVPYGPGAMSHLYRMGRNLQPPGTPWEYRQFAHRWTVEELGSMLFEKSEIDMAVSQTVPLFDYWEDGLSSVERNHALAEAYPDRVIFVGGCDPVFQGVDGALRTVTHQITEMGARSIKFYNAHSAGRSWRCDNRTLAYPLYERMLELGCNIAQFHKGNPIGLEPMEDLQPYDLQRVALDFPDLNIIIHHLGVPWVDETIAIAARFPNIHLAMSTWVNNIAVSPWSVAERVGKLMFYVGAERIIWGSETPLWLDPQLLLEMSWDLQIPEELQEKFGYPEITDSDRNLVFGGNMCRLLGIDPEAKKKELGLIASDAG